MEIYADIVVPMPLDALTFAIDSSTKDSISLGARVIVQVGQRKFYTGIVWRIHNNRPNYKNIKTIESVVDARSCLPAQQMQLFEWVAQYYMCPLGLVVKTALPSLFKNDGYILEQVQSQGAKKKTLTHVVLHNNISSEEQLCQRLDLLKRSPKQHLAMINYISLCEGGKIDFSNPLPIALPKIDVSASIISQLKKKELLEIVELEVEETLDSLPQQEGLPLLSTEQSTSLEAINNTFKTKDKILFRGVTGSGKTEIYIHLIAQMLSQGSNVLFMIPEIALSTQLLDRLTKYFGNRVVTYHSRLSDRQRALLYSRLLDSEQRGLLIVGVRSSIFLPVQNLGLVIVDEEHDGSYKQSDKSPSYNARDTALVLASIAKARTLLASATPSLESYYNTLSGKYGYVELDVRYSGIMMPEIIISDSRRAAHRGERKDHINILLKNQIEQTLSINKQVMLFQNRRGFSPYMECGDCGYIPTCPDCSVSLTYHKSDNSLRCHYCGYTMTLPDRCPKCKAEDMETQGFGTEKIEEILEAMFPEANIARLDADSTRAMGRLNRTIDSFKHGSIDILVGTQMITKGFDFGGVALVGILNADNMLHYPDFRASEKAYQTMMQVAGRAGRRDSQGQVIIQTSQADNPTIHHVCRGDYNSFCQAQLREREMFLYPPFSRMIKITLSARVKTQLWQGAYALAKDLREIFGRRTLGPEAPPLERLRGNYNAVITIKIERKLSFARAKQLIKQSVNKHNDTFKNIAIYYDVDPI
ncbi:MAG: primosomal protein N' [Rikenellaceae bacterium]